MCLLKTGLGIKEKRTLIKAWILLYVSAFLLGGILNVFQPYVRGGAVFLILAFAGYHLCLGIWDLLAYFHKNMAGSSPIRVLERKMVRCRSLCWIVCVVSVKRKKNGWKNHLWQSVRDRSFPMYMT